MLGPSPRSRGGRGLPLFDPDGAPVRLFVAVLVLGTLAGLPLGVRGLLCGAACGFVLGVLVAGFVTVVATWLAARSGDQGATDQRPT